jgi:hypothetical protein
MNTKKYKRIAEKLGIYNGHEFTIAVNAIQSAENGEINKLVASRTHYSFILCTMSENNITAGEYLTIRGLWDLVD